MGFNTVALFLNDQADQVRKRPEELAEGLYRAMCSGVGSEDPRYNIYLPGQTAVLKSQHADTLQIVVAGGNTIRALGYVHWTKFSDDKAILKALADDLGFRIVRKRARQGTPS